MLHDRRPSRVKCRLEREDRSLFHRDGHIARLRDDLEDVQECGGVAGHAAHAERPTRSGFVRRDLPECQILVPGGQCAIRAEGADDERRFLRGVVRLGVSDALALRAHPRWCDGEERGRHRGHDRGPLPNAVSRWPAPQDARHNLAPPTRASFPPQRRKRHDEKVESRLMRSARWRPSAVAVPQVQDAASCRDAPRAGAYRETRRCRRL